MKPTNSELEARIAVLEKERAELSAKLALEELNGAAIMDVRARLEEWFGPEVRAAFFDDEVHNATILAGRRGAEQMRERAALLADMGPARGTKCAPAVIALAKRIRALPLAPDADKGEKP